MAELRPGVKLVHRVSSLTEVVISEQMRFVKGSVDSHFGSIPLFPVPVVVIPAKNEGSSTLRG